MYVYIYRYICKYNCIYIYHQHIQKPSLALIKSTGNGIRPCGKNSYLHFLFSDCMYTMIFIFQIF